MSSNQREKLSDIKKRMDNDLVILDKTPFYVEAGGQIDDHGKIIMKGEDLPVIDVVKIDNKIVHVLKLRKSGIISPGLEVIAHVDEKRRWDIMRNHSRYTFPACRFERKCSAHMFIRPVHMSVRIVFVLILLIFQN